MIEKLYIALCRDKGKIVGFLKEPFTPIVPVEPKVPKVIPEKKERKKFSREDAMKIFKSGASYSEIAAIYGVSRVAIWKALNKLST